MWEILRWMKCKMILMYLALKKMLNNLLKDKIKSNSLQNKDQIIIYYEILIKHKN
jgi:hypothetical protein